MPAAPPPISPRLNAGALPSRTPRSKSASLVHEKVGSSGTASAMPPSARTVTAAPDAAVKHPISDESDSAALFRLSAE